MHAPVARRSAGTAQPAADVRPGLAGPVGLQRTGRRERVSASSTAAPAPALEVSPGTKVPAEPAAEGAPAGPAGRRGDKELAPGKEGPASARRPGDRFVLRCRQPNRVPTERFHRRCAPASARTVDAPSIQAPLLRSRRQEGRRRAGWVRGKTLTLHDQHHKTPAGDVGARLVRVAARRDPLHFLTDRGRTGRTVHDICAFSAQYRWSGPDLRRKQPPFRPGSCSALKPVVQRHGAVASVRYAAWVDLESWCAGRRHRDVHYRRRLMPCWQR